MLRPLLFTALLVATSLSWSQEARTEIARQPLPPQLRQRADATEPQRVATPIEAPSSEDAASEFGEQMVLIRQAQWDPWRADAGVSLFYTDNVALAPHRVDDWFMKYDVSAGYSNRIGGAWSLDVSVAQSFVRYDAFDALDFDLLRADAGVSYQASWLDDASIFLRYSFYRITGPGYGHEILRNHSLAFGVQKIWKISQGQQLFFGLSTEPSLQATPEIAQRHEHSVFGGWSLRLTEQLTAQVSGRVGYHITPITDREDWNYVALGGLSYAFTDWAQLSLMGSMAWNESNKSIFTYRNTIAGVSLGLHLAF